jgi:hypothetical protein
MLQKQVLKLMKISFEADNFFIMGPLLGNSNKRWYVESCDLLSKYIVSKYFVKYFHKL